MGYDFSQVVFLIVDDNAHMRRLVRGLLQAFGAADIREAVDGSAAFEMMAARMPDVIVTDFVMAPMNGVDFTRRVRTGPGCPDPYVPIIMMTGFTEAGRIFEARDAGVTEIVAKPLTAAALYSRLVAVIEHPRPFVKAGDYFGPDRRRRQEPYEGADRRQTPPRAATVPPDGDGAEVEWV